MSLAGLAAFLRSPAARVVAIAALVLLAIGWVYAAGQRSLRPALAAAEAEAARFERQIEIAEQLALRDRAFRNEALAIAHNNQERIDAYERTLAEAGGACLLDESDARFLRGIEP